MKENEDPAGIKRRLSRERQQRWRERQSQETLARLRREDSEATRRRHHLETTQQTRARLEANAEAQRLRRQRETLQQTQTRRAANAARQHLAQERQSQGIRNEAINFAEAQVDAHNCGPMNIICQFCCSRNFVAERPSDGKFTSCCRKGKLKLPRPMDVNGVQQAYPDFLRNFLTSSAQFREHIRSYDSAVSFASLGAKIVDLPGRGPYVFKVHGQTYQRSSHLQPPNDHAPQFAQLYVLDSTQATEIRQEHAANEQCRQPILEQINRFFRQHNRIAVSYQMMREIEAQKTLCAVQAGEQIPVVSMVLRRDRHSDQRRYNAPLSNEVAMVFVNEDGEPPFARDIPQPGESAHQG